MVGQTFDDEFRYARNRIIVATFSSNVHRIQQVVDSAVKYKRKVAVIGRSMINVVNIAMELGYLRIPEGVLIDIDETNNYTSDQIVIITTGSQGEIIVPIFIKHYDSINVKTKFIIIFLR